MGRDKAQLEFEGTTLLERGRLALAQHCDPVLLACGSTPRPGFEESSVLDAEPGMGPLGGILAGLTAAPHDLCLLAAVDLPHLDRLPLAELVSRVREQDLDGAGLDDGRERPPLVWVLRKRAAETLSLALERGVRRVVEALAPLELGSLPVDPALTHNWNRPEDLEVSLERSRA